jgi:hypothetical protein
MKTAADRPRDRAVLEILHKSLERSKPAKKEDAENT